jgi:hypothetical protein
MGILEGENWKAWVSGKGYSIYTNKKGNQVALIMTSPRQFNGKAVLMNGKWMPRIYTSHWHSFPGAKGCKTLDECRKLIEGYRVPSYQEYVRGLEV